MANKTLLGALVEKEGWEFPDFQREFRGAGNELARNLKDSRFRNLDMSEATFRRWVAGTVSRPTGVFVQTIRHLFDDRPIAELLAPPREGDPTALSRQDLERELAMTAREASDHAASVASAFLSDLSIEQVQEDVRRLARTYNNRPPFDVLREARQLRADAEELLDRTHIPEQRQQLLIAIGQTTALLAMTAFDLGSLGEATRLARSAGMYAEATRFNPLAAFAAGTLGMLAYWEGRPSEAIRFIRQANSFTGVGAAGRTRIAAIEARAYGHLGDRQRATTAVERALDLDTAEVDDLHDEVAGEFLHGPERISRSHGTTFLLLRDSAAAQEHARHVLELQAALPEAQRMPRIEAEARADLAAALILGNELDEAAEVLKPITALAPERRAAGLVERVVHVGRLLTTEPARTSPGAIALKEALEEYTRVAAPRQIVGGSVARLAIE
ncbi:DNA-binding protein [Kitasatospora purpeofusca]|uniref:DNA-binding protein n=1 Tax=Kitasatospora purpeofusca TaxID=67352 RepID=UPI002258F861|nr:DNA-binding protein [Kitasatospora purpeofusca]MCX4758685.1 DNA-binding protein [Kitasatospora purpeofusca]WSR30881.1 DNA-binding protein [Kitasatospora purpeofusca]